MIQYLLGAWNPWNWSDISCNKMEFSVIIPAYNAEKTIDSCIQALLSQSIPREQYEIILVDDGSTDATAKIVQTYPVIYHYQKNKGPAAARNKGTTISKGKIILFTDSDCVPDHFWIQEMVSPFLANPEISGVKGAYKTKQKGLTARFAQAEFEDRFVLLGKSSFIDMVDTYSAAFKRDIFIKAGGFDPFFPVANNEDTELSYRLVSDGHLLVFNSRAFVYHTHPNTLGKYLKIKFWRGYWRMVVYARYPEKAIKDSYTPAVIKIQTLLMLLLVPILIIGFFFWRIHAYCILGLMVTIMVTSVPFSLASFKKDKAVGLFSPFYCLLRAAVFAAGSAGGILYVVIDRIFRRYRRLFNNQD